MCKGTDQYPGEIAHIGNNNPHVFYYFFLFWSEADDVFEFSLLLVCTSVSLYNLIHNVRTGLMTFVANLNSGSKEIYSGCRSVFAMI